MNTELEKKLIDKYPSFFKDIYGDPTKTGLSWGLECGDGWYDLIDSLCKAIKNRLDNIEWSNHSRKSRGEELLPIPDITITQIKEKFGTLRFYYVGGDSAIDHLIDFAEIMSGKICEVCGNKGTLQSEGWCSTRCKEHE